MLTKKTILDQIEITRNGTIQLRFAKLVLENEEEISSRWHRTVINPGTSVEEQLAHVNDHLMQMGEEPVTFADVNKIQAVVDIVHVPEFVAKYQAEKEAADVEAVLNTTPKGNISWQ
jgi:hypothetical protein